MKSNHSNKPTFLSYPTRHLAASIACALALCSPLGCNPPLSQDAPDNTASGHQNITNLPADTDLVAEWPLDGSGTDVWGGHNVQLWHDDGFTISGFLTSTSNQIYGPTGRTTLNGGEAPDLTSVDLSSQGLTMEGWVRLPSNNTGGVLFGFGDEGWGIPKLHVVASWGYIDVEIGKYRDGGRLRYQRLGDDCWHHLALVLPADVLDTSDVRFYIDGVLTSPEQPVTLSHATEMFGARFRLGTFSKSDAGSMKLDQVRLWSRALTASEVAQEAQHDGSAPRCSPRPLPGCQVTYPRCTPPAQLPSPQAQLVVRVMDDDTITVVTDPVDWIASRVQADCGAFLQQVEQKKASGTCQMADWDYSFHYNFAVADTMKTYRPSLLHGVETTGHFIITDDQGNRLQALKASTWPESERQNVVSAVAPGTGTVQTDSADVDYNTYLKLDGRLQSGRTYTVTDAWGNSTSFTYAPTTTTSVLFKINQAGYPQHSPANVAYLGGWLGPQQGAMDLSSFEGASFTLRDASDDSVAFTGTVHHRPASTQEPAHTGEDVYELDFSAFTGTGTYYLSVDGIGRSDSFVVGPDAMGKLFYTMARGLYHQRCAVLDPQYTAWPRGDAHHTLYVANYPPERSDYDDHSQDGWGFLDDDGHYVNIKEFDAVSATKTDQVAEGVYGGWHDAGDYDKKPDHLNVVQMLSMAYLLNPTHFKDGQLHIPESGNGIPDILDEAMWGLDLYRRAQLPSGAVPTRVEAEDHPQHMKPDEDTQRYYVSLATRNSSLHYARYAVMLGAALARAGKFYKAWTYIQSAKRAYAFGTDPNVRVQVSFTYQGKQVHWIEPADPSATLKLYASTYLWFATLNSTYRDALNTPEMQAAFEQEIKDLPWRVHPMDLMVFAIPTAGFTLPSGWASQARTALIDVADHWLTWQNTHAYRNAWYSRDHGYFKLMGWGANGYRAVTQMTAGWLLTHDQKYKTGILHGLNWMLGTNPMGLSLTTGVGEHFVPDPLHLPSLTDGIAEPVPGLTVFGFTGANAWAGASRVYGLLQDPRADHHYDGATVNLLPSPWGQAPATFDGIRGVMDQQIPTWRRFVMTGRLNVPETEFSIWETMAPGVGVVGVLLDSAWMPSAADMNRQPRTDAQMRAMLRMMP